MWIDRFQGEMLQKMRGLPKLPGLPKIAEIEASGREWSGSLLPKFPA
jgi:hypothetical protein